MKSGCKRMLAFFMVLGFFLSIFPSTVKAAVSSSTSESTSVNHYNVVIIMDASASLSKTDGNATDEEGLRFEALAQFVGLLAEEGNYLGGVAYASEVDAVVELAESTPEQKDSVISALSVIHENSYDEDGNSVGHTNTGAAFEAAMELLQRGADQNLDSIIVYFGDGQTELPKTADTDASLELEEQYVSLAADEGVPVYCICLNSNGNNKKGIDEMKSIAAATDGEFQEIESAEDLVDAFNVFYNMIYNTAQDDVSGTFDSDGELEVNFTVPGIGVEEINVIVNGETDDITLKNPDGDEVEYSNVYTSGQASSSAASGLIRMIKVGQADVTSGEWTLDMVGNPGDSVQVKLVFNTNLGLAVTADADGEEVGEDGTVIADTVEEGASATLNVAAALTASGVAAAEEQYEGYEAELHILNAQTNEVMQTVAMTVGEEGFEASCELGEGSYKFEVYVDYPGSSGSPLFEYTSETSGTVKVKSDPTPEPDPVAPTAVEDPKTYSVNVWPVAGGSVEVNFEELFEEEDLVYDLEPNAYTEITDENETGDYELDENTMTVKLGTFAVSKQTYRVTAVNEDGLKTTVQVIISPNNFTVIGTIILVVIIIIVVAVIIGNIIYWSRKPFYGKMTVRSGVNGIYKTGVREGGRGKCKLSAFQVDNVGLQGSKCYMQATGDNYIFFITNQDVFWNGQKTRKVRIQSGAQTTVVVGEGRVLELRFDGRVKGSKVKAPKAPKPPKAPKAPKAPVRR